MKKITISTLLVGAFFALPTTFNPANATVFSGASGNLKAQATFDVSGSNLVVTLTNNSGADVLVPSDVLTAVFFNLRDVGALTPVSALLGSGSTVFYDPDGQPAGGVVGGEWGYSDSLIAADAHGATKGISSSGLGGVFQYTPEDYFPGPDLQSPTALDGLQYGILSAGDNENTGNGGITGSGGLIKNSVVFTLSDLPVGFNLQRDLSNVWFQYGTAMNEPGFWGVCVEGCGGGSGNGNPVPEPGTLALLGVGIAGLAGARRRKN